MLTRLDEGLWTAEGEPIDFLGFPYEIRMTVVRLGDGSLWLHSPVQISGPLREAVDALGPVRHLVTPNKLHHLFLRDWKEAYPDAKLWAPPGLARRRPSLSFDGELGDEPEPGWADVLDQRVVRGSWAMEEVIFFHRPTRTLVLGDLIENHRPERFTPGKRRIARLNRMFGDTPINWRVTFWNRGPARETMREVLGWEPRRVVVMHGPCIDRNAGEELRRAFRWLVGSSP